MRSSGSPDALDLAHRPLLLGMFSTAADFLVKVEGFRVEGLGRALAQPLFRMLLAEIRSAIFERGFACLQSSELSKPWAMVSYELW